MTFPIPLLSSAQSSLLQAPCTRGRYSLSRCSVPMEYNTSYSALPLPTALCGYQYNTPLLPGWARCMGTVGDLTWIICLLTTPSGTSSVSISLPCSTMDARHPLWKGLLPQLSHLNTSYMPQMNTSQTFPLLAACTTCKRPRCCPKSSSHICSISCLQTSQDTLRIFSEFIPVINDTIDDVLPGTCAYSISKM